MRSMRYFERGRTRVSVLSQIRQTRCQDGAVSANFTSNWDASATECVQPLHRFERFGSAAVGGSSTRPRRHLHREVRARRLANPLLCRTHTHTLLHLARSTHTRSLHVTCQLAGGLEFCGGLGHRGAVRRGNGRRDGHGGGAPSAVTAAAKQKQATRARRYERQPPGAATGEEAVAVRTGASAGARCAALVDCPPSAAHASPVPSPSLRVPCRLLPPRQAPCPRPRSPAPCPRPLTPAPALVRSCLPLPSPAHASPCPRKLTPAPLRRELTRHASSLASAGAHARSPSSPAATDDDGDGADQVEDWALQPCGA